MNETNEIIVLQCKDFANGDIAFGCCDSCHDDLDTYSMDMCTWQERDYPDSVAEICCNVVECLERMDATERKKLWEKILREKEPNP